MYINFNTIRVTELASKYYEPEHYLLLYMYILPNYLYKRIAEINHHHMIADEFCHQIRQTLIWPYVV